MTHESHLVRRKQLSQTASEVVVKHSGQQEKRKNMSQSVGERKVETKGKKNLPNYKQKISRPGKPNNHLLEDEEEQV